MESKGDGGGPINSYSVSREGKLVVMIHCDWSQLILFKEVFLFFSVQLMFFTGSFQCAVPQTITGI